VHRLLAAGITKFLELNFTLDKFFVFPAPVIDPFAVFARQFYELILGHSIFDIDLGTIT